MENRTEVQPCSGDRSICPSCTECQDETRLVVVLTTYTPQIRIYKCQACGHYEWVEESRTAALNSTPT
jgi:hypothetical protein